MKFALLLSCTLLAGSHLLGADIQILNVTSLDFSSIGTSPRVSFSGSGDSFVINGSEGLPGGGRFVLPGSPIGPVIEGFAPGAPNFDVGGNLIQPAFQLFQVGPLNTTTFGFQISGNSNALVPETSSVITLPGMAVGGFSAMGCGPLEIPPHCTGPHFADILIDLPGTFSLTFFGNGLGTTILEEVHFTATPIPEPSSVLLAIAGYIIVGVLLWRRASIGAPGDR